MSHVPDDLVELTESGVSLFVGTRDASHRPDAARACGAVVGAERDRITVFLPVVSAAKSIANVRENGRIALGVQRPFDNACFQIKGTAIELHDATPAEQPIVERYLAAFVEALYIVGLPRGIVKRFVVWPATAVTFRVDDVFVQTPGPEAGRRLER